MEIAALVVSLLAAAFAGSQWWVARKARDEAARANSIAARALALSQEVDSRGAVRWEPRFHHRDKSMVGLFNVGHSTAYDVSIDPTDLAQIRLVYMPSTGHDIPPDEALFLDVATAGDLADLPDSVVMTYSTAGDRAADQTKRVSLVPILGEATEIARSYRDPRTP